MRGCAWTRVEFGGWSCWRRAGLRRAQGPKTITVGADGRGLYDDSGGGDCGAG